MFDKIYIYVLVKLQDFKYFFKYTLFGKETPNKKSQEQDPFVYEE